MSEINANIVISPIDLGVTVNTNQLSFTPEPIGLNFYTGGLGVPGGASGTVQFNAGGVLNGTSNLTYSGGVTTISNVNVSTYANLGNISNVHITGGAANFALITDGSGNLSWGQVANATYAANANYANFAGTAFSVAGANVTGTVATATTATTATTAGTVTTAAQSNITSLGNLTGVKSNGLANFVGASNVALGAVGNVHITGGTNGQFLQTDGAGNIAWVSGGGSGNGVVGGSDTQIQFNDGGSFGGNAGFTFNKTTGNVAIPNNLSVTSNIISANANLGNAVVANYFIGNLYGQANTTNTANTVTTNAQPNITSTGTLTSLAVTGNISAGNVSATTFTGALTGVATSATTAGTVTTAAQPNITSFGTLVSLDITGNLNSNGTLILYEAIENVGLIGAQTGTYNFNILDGSIQFSTANATANLTLNFRGNSSISANSLLSNGKCVTSTYLMTTGANAYGIGNIQIDGSSQTISWVGNFVPQFISSTKESFTFTIIKTSTTPTYTVLGSMTRYG